MADLYRFSDPVGLDVKTWLSYVPYSGSAFVAAWRDDRARACAILPPPCPPAASTVIALPDTEVIDDEVLTEWLWNALPAGDPRARTAFARMLTYFEVVRKVAPAYNHDFKPLETKSRGSLEAHVRLAECFARAHAEDGFLGTLNVLIKAVDTLIALAPAMDAQLGARLHGLILAENQAIAALAARIGVEI